jgi:predicted methyltransferase
MSATEINVPGFMLGALASPRRPEDERERDAVRQLDELLAFYGVRPGWKVADLMASRGYVAGALAELVGEDGQVLAHNAPALLARFKGENPIEARIRDCGLTNLVSVVAELESPGLPEGELDAVFSFMFYHDTVWVGTDRAAMNAAVYRALKPGGIYAIVDHHAPAGTGTGHARDLHRIERSVVVDEVLAAGFQLAGETDLLENPDDPLNVMVHDKSVKDVTSKFVLKFVKPRA